MSDKEQLERLKEAQVKYDERVAKVLQKIPERKAEFVNTSGIPINRVYTPLEMEGFDYLKQLGMPGQYP
jgi:methylmalonyl-CoA mutase N-terminal domain/subunit